MRAVLVPIFSLCVGLLFLRVGYGDVPATQPEFTGTSVVYLCSTAESMKSVLGTAKSGLDESIKSLRMDQGFNVILFSEDKVVLLFKDGPHAATEENRKKGVELVDGAVAAGKALPMDAIKEVVKENPKLVFLLADGFDKTVNVDDVASAFWPEGTDLKMHVNCIYFENSNEDAVAGFKKIAEKNHGIFKKILKSDT